MLVDRLVTTTDVLLDICDVGKTYPRAAVGSAPSVADVDLRIQAGCVTGIVGESGSGKTTLARIMSGLLAPSTGYVAFDGVRIDTLNKSALRRLRRQLQYVHQDPAAALDPRLRIADILHEPLIIHTNLRRADRLIRIQAMLSAVGVSPAVLERYPHQISGGQQRRIGLARILIIEPRLVVLDEPTAGLDLLVQASLLTLLDDLRARFGLTYVIVTHDLTVVSAICDEVAVMYRGRVVEHGATRDVLDFPRHPYTRELLSSLPRLDGPRVIDGIALRVPDDASTWSPVGCSFLRRCPSAQEICARERPRLERRSGRETACWNDLPQ